MTITEAISLVTEPRVATRRAKKQPLHGPGLHAPGHCCPNCNTKLAWFVHSTPEVFWRECFFCHYEIPEKLRKMLKEAGL